MPGPGLVSRVTSWLRLTPIKVRHFAGPLMVLATIAALTTGLLYSSPTARSSSFCLVALGITHIITLRVYWLMSKLCALKFERFLSTDVKTAQPGEDYRYRVRTLIMVRHARYKRSYERLFDSIQALKSALAAKPSAADASAAARIERHEAHLKKRNREINLLTEKNAKDMGCLMELLHTSYGLDGENTLEDTAGQILEDIDEKLLIEQSVATPDGKTVEPREDQYILPMEKNPLEDD